MSCQVTISKRGTITIPAAVSKALGLKAGQKVQQSLERGRVIVDFHFEPEKVRVERGKAKRK